jgi:hypothetical protein
MLQHIEKRISWWCRFEYSLSDTQELTFAFGNAGVFPVLIDMYLHGGYLAFFSMACACADP